MFASLLLRALARDVDIAHDVRRVGDASIHARRVADRGRPPVVCVHGMVVTSRYFVPTMRELAGAADVWAPDLADGSSLEVAHLADRLVAWMAAAEIGPAVLLANSFGCQVAVDAAVRHPASVSAVVLNGPTTDPQARSSLGQVVRWARTSRSESLLQLPLLAEDYLEFGPWRTPRMLRAVLGDAVETKLARLVQPAVVVRGEHDAIAPQDWVEEVVRLLPRGRLVVVPGAAHTVNFTHPAELAAVVRDVLAEVGA